MTATIFDPRRCALGEGPLWHPIRQQLFWFDIIGKRMLSQSQEWQFDEHVSAAGWVNATTLLIASETQLFTFDVETEEQTFVTALETGDTVTRSNDGRADPWGGFWIGTMGKSAEPGAGAIYRYFKGELRRIRPNITISNAICFAPDRSTAFFCDTPSQQIMKLELDADGWPDSNPQVHIDLTGTDFNPDGAVVDSKGHLWNAQWGSHRVARYDEAGQFVDAIEFSASQISCPAFGGPHGKTLFVTSAADGMPANDTSAGLTFAVETDHRGQQEHQVIL